MYHICGDLMQFLVLPKIYNKHGCAPNFNVYMKAVGLEVVQFLNYIVQYSTVFQLLSNESL